MSRDFTPDELPASPVAAVFEKAEFVKAGGDVASFENAVTTDADIAKTLIANRMGCEGIRLCGRYANRTH